MINNISNVFQRFFGREHGSQQPGMVSSERVQSVIISRFLEQTDPIFREEQVIFKEIKARLVSTVFDHNQTFKVSDQTPTIDDIFHWFINSTHASGLYQRAIQSRDSAVESFFRHSGVSINQADEKTGNTPLMLAAKTHQPELTQRLIAKGADVSAVNAHNESAIYQAIYQCVFTDYEKEPAFKTIRTLLNAMSLRQCPAKIADIVFTHTDLKIAKLFVDLPIRHFESIVNELVKSKRSECSEILREVLSRHPELVNIRDNKQMTPLMIAASLNNPSTLKVLLEQSNVDIEATCQKIVSGFNKEWTAYSFAYDNSHNQCIKLLEHYGAHQFSPSLSLKEVSYLESKYSYKFHKELAIIANLLGMFLALAYLNSKNYFTNKGLVNVALIYAMTTGMCFLYCLYDMKSKEREVQSRMIRQQDSQ